MRHSRVPIGLIQYSLRYPQLIATSPPLEACEQRGRLCRSLFAKNSLHPSFFSEYGTGETQGQTLRLDVFIRSLRTSGGGAGWFRHETELEVALCLDHWEDHSLDTIRYDTFSRGSLWKLFFQGIIDQLWVIIYKLWNAV